MNLLSLWRAIGEACVTTASTEINKRSGDIVGKRACGNAGAAAKVQTVMGGWTDAGLKSVRCVRRHGLVRNSNSKWMALPLVHWAVAELIVLTGGVGRSTSTK